MKKFKKLIIAALSCVILVGATIGTYSTARAAGCPMALVAQNLGTCNLSYSQCKGTMSAYRCTDWLCGHYHVICTNGHKDCNRAATCYD